VSGLVTIGETLALVSSAKPGHLAHTTSLDLRIGGAESNVAIGVRRLGVPAAWVGRVGADSLGLRVLREMRAESVDLEVITDDRAPTGLMVKERRSPESTHIWYYRIGSAGSRLTPEDLPAARIGSADVLHLTGITPGLSDTALATTRAAVDLAIAHDVPISFDVNHRAGVWGDRDAGPTYSEFASEATVVFAGPEEARLLTGSTEAEPQALLEALALVNKGDVVLKLGGEGCLAWIDGKQFRLDAVQVPVMDTVGAGDAFVAGYLAEFINGLTPEGRLSTAITCGALACTGEGDWEAFPRREDLDRTGNGDSVRR
jgi:2-dehydro-3-deoxygluconokinase